MLTGEAVSSAIGKGPKQNHFVFALINRDANFEIPVEPSLFDSDQATAFINRPLILRPHVDDVKAGGETRR